MTGSDQLVRTYGTLSSLEQITATLTRANPCDDHIIIASTSPSVTWSWSTAAGSVKFAFNCGSKVIYAQTSSASTPCNAYGSYSVTVGLSATQATFDDDNCGALTRSDTLGAAAALYVYLGADDDADAAVWRSVNIWGDPQWTPATASGPPTPAPCEDYTLDMFDSWGDGWNGNELSIRACGGPLDGALLAGGITLGSGASAATVLCLPAGAPAVAVDVGGGAYPSEVSWALELPSGAILSGGAGGTASSAAACAGDVFSFSYGGGGGGGGGATPSPSPAPAELGPPDVSDAFGAFNPALWLAPCAGCSYAGGRLLVAGTDNLMRSRGALAGLTHLRATLVKASSCDDHALVLSTEPALGWSWSTTPGAAKFVWNWCVDNPPARVPALRPAAVATAANAPVGLFYRVKGAQEAAVTPCRSCLRYDGSRRLAHPRPTCLHAPPSNNKYIYAQTSSASTLCGVFRTYAVEISVYSSGLSFQDDFCGALTRSDALGAAAALYIYVGADCDGCSAAWLDLSAWGAPSWDEDWTTLPSPAPTASPAPTPGPGPPALADAFGAFNPSYWLAACAGCSYSGGSLFVAGSDMLMRTVGTLTGLRRIEGTLVKATTCSDHTLVVSTSYAAAWSWGSTVGSVRLAWNCQLKVLYGQAGSAQASCPALRTYAVAVALGPAAVAFVDDACGTLALPDPIRGAADAAGVGLYVYLGADHDSGAAEWADLAIWGEPTWASFLSPFPTPLPVLAPTPAPTPGLGGPAFTDSFLAFEPRFWQEPCPGCSWAAGSLLVDGDAQRMRSAGALEGLRRVEGRLTKADACDDHFLVVSTLADLSWTWSTTPGAAKFVWNWWAGQRGPRGDWCGGWCRGPLLLPRRSACKNLTTFPPPLYSTAPSFFLPTPLPLCASAATPNTSWAPPRRRASAAPPRGPMTWW